MQHCRHPSSNKVDDACMPGQRCQQQFARFKARMSVSRLPRGRMSVPAALPALAQQAPCPAQGRTLAGLCRRRLHGHK